MHKEILDNKRLKLLKEISMLSFIKQFSMGGGTALSLQLGLRQSFDFDFFANWHFLPEQLFEEMQIKFGKRIQKLNETTNLSTLEIYIDNVQISFFECKHILLQEPVIISDIANISLLSINDIVCMKCVAIVQRGTKKDFFDLFFALKLKNIDANMLIKMLEKKYNDKNLLINFCYSMIYFEDADDNILPKSFVNYSWDEIKNYFKELQISIVKILK